jgi:hypothetical protein
MTLDPGKLRRIHDLLPKKFKAIESATATYGDDGLVNVRTADGRVFTMTAELYEEYRLLAKPRMKTALEGEFVYFVEGATVERATQVAPDWVPIVIVGPDGRERGRGMAAPEIAAEMVAHGKARLEVKSE